MNITDELSGKRLLILGGSLWRNTIQKFCKENNITIVAAGYNPNAGIAEIADEYYCVNSTEAQTMKRLIREKRIDGVYLGGDEPVIHAACQYVNELGLPCYCTPRQWNALQNKSSFKELCVKHGLPVVRKYEAETIEPADFPVITKPADGCGSNGFTVCHNMEEYKQGYSLAKSSSPTETVIIEKFVPNNGVVVFYTISKGKVYFSALEDKYPVFFKEHGTYVGGLFDFESKLKNEFRERFEGKIQQMISELGIEHGSFWIEVFHDGDNYYFNEIGFRYGGSGSLYPVQYCSGINQVASDIYFALTGKSRIDGFDTAFCKQPKTGQRYAVYPVYVQSGIIGTVNISTAFKERGNIAEILHMKKAGSEIPNNGSFGQVVLLVHFTYGSLEELVETIRDLHERISITNEDGEETAIKLLDFDNLQLRGVL